MRGRGGFQGGGLCCLRLDCDLVLLDLRQLLLNDRLAVLPCASRGSSCSCSLGTLGYEVLPVLGLGDDLVVDMINVAFNRDVF